MSVNPTAYKQAAYPPTPWAHLSDEDISAQLDTSAKHSRAAHKGQERRRQNRAEASRAESEKRA